MSQPPVRIAVASLVTTGLPLAHIAAQVGVSRQRAHQIVHKDPTLLAQWRSAVQQRGAAELVTRAEATRANREATRARCASCGRLLRRPRRTDGRPQFCAQEVRCRAAYKLYRYHHSERARATLKRWAASERGRESMRRAWKKQNAKQREARKKDRPPIGAVGARIGDALPAEGLGHLAR